MLRWLWFSGFVEFFFHFGDDFLRKEMFHQFFVLQFVNIFGEIFHGN